MEHREGRFKGLKDLDLYYRCWLPDGEPKAVLLVVPGLAEHCGRYTNLVDYFVPKGYAVYRLEHCGHLAGHNTGLYVTCMPVPRLSHLTLALEV